MSWEVPCLVYEGILWPPESMIIMMISYFLFFGFFFSFQQFVLYYKDPPFFCHHSKKIHLLWNSECWLTAVNNSRIQILNCVQEKLSLACAMKLEWFRKWCRCCSKRSYFDICHVFSWKKKDMNTKNSRSLDSLIQIKNKILKEWQLWGIAIYRVRQPHS